MWGKLGQSILGATHRVQSEFWTVQNQFQKKK